MKKCKIILSVFFSLILLCFTTSMNVFSASFTQDGLEVILSTDKESYNSSDAIKATLFVKNTNDFDVFNVTLEEYIPEGYVLSNDSTAKVSIEKLAAGEELSLQAIMVSQDNVTTTTTSTTVTTQTSSTKPTTTTTKTSTTQSTSTSDSPGTGDDTNIFLLISIFGACSIILIITIFAKKKTRNTILSLLLCLSLTRLVYAPILSQAANENDKSISISETVKVADKNVTINAKVIYTINNNGDESMSPADEYYHNTSEKIVSTEYANENNSLSEAEVFALLTEKNLNQHPISYEYDINGNYIDETTIDKNSNVKHPMYQTMYVTSEGEVWNIFIVGKTIYASALSYYYETDTEIEYIFGETETLICYAEDTNKYYITIPKNTVVAYNVINSVDAETLDKFTFEEIDKL